MVLKGHWFLSKFLCLNFQRTNLPKTVSPKKQILYKNIENSTFKSSATNEAVPSSGNRESSSIPLSIATENNLRDSKRKQTSHHHWETHPFANRKLFPPLKSFTRRSIQHGDNKTKRSIGHVDSKSLKGPRENSMGNQIVGKGACWCGGWPQTSRKWK